MNTWQKCSNFPLSDHGDVNLALKAAAWRDFFVKSL